MTVLSALPGHGIDALAGRFFFCQRMALHPHEITCTSDSYRTRPQWQHKQAGYQLACHSQSQDPETRLLAVLQTLTAARHTHCGAVRL